MSDETKRAVRSQFGRQASWYTVSRVHRQSEGLAALLRLAAPTLADRALDVATGTGFTALALAPRCREVVGVDFTAGMIREAQTLREARSVTNLCFCLGDAEALPFSEGAFDIVACRHASHHFPHLPAALAEMTRVARPGGRIVLEDTCAPDDPRLAALMNAWERRRDPSHVANHPPSRLAEMLEESGVRVADAVMARIPLEFNDWVRRSGVPEHDAAVLRECLLRADPEAASTFGIAAQDGDVRFAWDEIVILGIKP
jgi:ubiquinone/menaquinone biosynthesis C-methylase UbiE